MSDYAHPEVLVTTEWVAAHAKEPGIRLVEVDVDTSTYDQGHMCSPCFERLLALREKLVALIYGCNS